MISAAKHSRSAPRLGAIALFSAVVASVSFASAQQTAGGSSGTFGARSMGSSFTPSAGGFTAAGNRGASGNGMAAGGMGGVSGMTTRGDNSVGQVTGNERFVRGARQPGQFVGADRADSNNFMSQLSSMAQQGQFGPQRNNQTTNPNRTQNNRGQQRTMPRVQLDIGFEQRLAPPTVAALALQNRFTASSRPGLRGRVIVNLEGRTAVLRGSVATEHDRVLAEQVALLEGGVDRVRNELTLIPANQPSAANPTAVPQAESVPPSANPPALRLVPPTTSSPGNSTPPANSSPTNP